MNDTITTVNLFSKCIFCYLVIINKMINTSLLNAIKTKILLYNKEISIYLHYL